MPFKKGQGGRPKGAKNKNTLEFMVLADERLFSDTSYLRHVFHRIHVGQAPALELYCWQRKYGKPREGVDVALSGELSLRTRMVDEFHSS